MLEKFFKLKENGTDAKTEILAGITTFMTMAYILQLIQVFWLQLVWIRVPYLQQQLLRL